MTHNSAMRQPQAWPELLDSATGILQSRGKLETKVGALVCDVRALSDEDQEHNRYYALSLATCEWAKAMHNPDIYNKAVRVHGDKILQNHKYVCQDNNFTYGDGLRVGSCVNTYTGKSTQYVPEIAVSKLDPGTRLLGNILEGIRQRRYEEDPLAAARSIFREQPEPLTGALMQFSTAASVIVGSRIRNEVARGDWGAWYSKKVSHMLLRDVVTLDTIKSFDDLHTAGFAAALRLDELMDLKSWLNLHEDGTISAKHSLLASPPAPQQPNSAVIHEQRLRCPALYVGGALKLALKFVQDTVSDAETHLHTNPSLYRRVVT